MHPLPSCMCTDESFQDTSDHLSKCNKYMSSLLASLGPAIKPITQLTLNIQPALHNQSSRYTLLNLPYQARPLSISTILMFEMLQSVSVTMAVNLPQLQHLHLTGQYTYVNLKEFGMHCPQLTSLEIQFCSFPKEVLQEIDTAMPNLSRLELSSPADDITQKDMQTCLMCVLLRISNCSKLKFLKLCVMPVYANVHQATQAEPRPKIKLDCSPMMCDMLPLSLTELESDAEIGMLMYASVFISRVRLLTLQEFPANNLPRLLTSAPLLQCMSVTYPSARHVVMLDSYEDTSTADLACLQERLLGGFRLICPSVSMTQTSMLVNKLITWMSPMHGTTSCSIKILPSYTPDLLEGLGRVFPDLTTLSLSDKSNWLVAPWMSERFLETLAQCEHLEWLDLAVQLNLTHVGLVKLCMSLPALSYLHCLPCEGVCLEGVMQELSSKGRLVSIS